MNPGQQTHLPLQPVAEAAQATLSDVACQVCGHHALQTQELHNGIARGLSSRLICQVCGAHRVAGT